MSETVLYGIKQGKKTLFIDEFFNSHGFGDVIWNVYFKHYLNIDMSNLSISCFSDEYENMYERLWKSYRDPAMPMAHKAVLWATYDYSVIVQDKIDLFIEHLDQWQKDFGEEISEYVNHVPNISESLKKNRKIISKFDAIGIQTTNMVSNQYDVTWNPNGRKPVKASQLKNMYKILENMIEEQEKERKEKDS